MQLAEGVDARAVGREPQAVDACGDLLEPDGIRLGEHIRLLLVQLHMQQRRIVFRDLDLDRTGLRLHLRAVFHAAAVEREALRGHISEAEHFRLLRDAGRIAGDRSAEFAQQIACLHIGARPERHP